MDLETRGAVGNKALMKVLQDEVSGGQAHPGQLQQAIYFLFFLNFFLISWRLITLQYCSGFCHTLK